MGHILIPCQIPPIRGPPAAEDLQHILIIILIILGTPPVARDLIHILDTIILYLMPRMCIRFHHILPTRRAARIMNGAQAGEAAVMPIPGQGPQSTL